MRPRKHKAPAWLVAAASLFAGATGCVGNDLADTGPAGLCPAFEVRYDAQLSGRNAWAIAASVTGFATGAEATMLWPAPVQGSVAGDLEVGTARVWLEFAKLGDPERSYEWGLMLNLWSLAQVRFLYPSAESTVSVRDLHRSDAGCCGVFFRIVLSPRVRVRFEETLGSSLAESLAALEVRLGKEAHAVVGWRAFYVGFERGPVELVRDVFGGPTFALSVRF